MAFKKLFAAGACLAISVGLTAGAFAQQTMPTTTTTTMVTPQESVRGTVNVDVIDNDNENFGNRIQTELVERPAPQVGQTRAAIEAIYGPATRELAPNKPYEVYTNERDLAGGRMFNRNLTEDMLRIYEVSYSAGATKSPNDKAVDVKLRVIPRIGDHKNLVNKMMGEPISKINDQQGQHTVYAIPKHRYIFYSDVLTSPFEAINTFYNAEGFMVGQEFAPGRYRGFHVLTSAGRYTELESKRQPDVKVLP